MTPNANAQTPTNHGANETTALEMSLYRNPADCGTFPSAIAPRAAQERVL
jgi:hypothetical protein